MGPSFSSKNGVRYRFYVSTALLRGRNTEAGSVARVSAVQIESLVVAALRGPDNEPGSIEMLERVIVARDHLRLTIAISSAASDERKTTAEKRIEWSSKDPATEVNGNGESPRVHDEGLIKSIVRAHAWMHGLRNRTYQSVERLAEQPSSPKGSSPKSPAGISFTGGDVSHFGTQTADVLHWRKSQSCCPYLGRSIRTCSADFRASNLSIPPVDSRLPARPCSTAPRCCGSKRRSVPHRSHLYDFLISWPDTLQLSPDLPRPFSLARRKASANAPPPRLLLWLARRRWRRRRAGISPGMPCAGRSVLPPRSLSRRSVSAMRLRATSTSSTFTLTMSPAFTTSRGSLTKLRHRGDVHQPVLMHADIDEGAERRDVGYRRLPASCRV